MIILRNKTFSKKKKIDSWDVNHKLETVKPGSQESGTNNVEYEDKPVKDLVSNKKVVEDEQKLLRPIKTRPENNPQTFRNSKKFERHPGYGYSSKAA